MEQINSKDSYERALDRELKSIQSCQESKSLKSCFECRELIGCEVRNRYVKAVYESMSRGESGDFEF